MKVGSTIVEIRKSNKLTQEEFAKLFHVTRQTVSNWENEKSYPDLQTLVDISDQFDISLDKMLKEDKGMVKQLDRQIKVGKALKKGVIGLLCILIVAGVVWSIFWYDAKQSLEEKFQTGIDEWGFSYSDQLGYYIKEIGDDTRFTLPNQKMPGWLDFSLDFHAKYLVCYLKRDDVDLELRWSGVGKNGKSIITISSGNKTLSSEEAENLIEKDPELYKLAVEAESIYKSVYK